jgi:YebC/PmpR family DNA-binding regulatory protein
MSGHSKWSTIKRQKGAQDTKRGQVFTKLSNAITIAVKQGGGISDPESNFKLRLVMDRARAANMPKENIERAIARAKGSGAEDVEELVYEGFAPHGVAVVVEAVTDNKQRTVADIKNLFERSGGTLGSPGSVSYLFKKRGEIVIRKNGLSSDELLSKGIEAGVEDMEEKAGLVFFYVDPSSLSQTKKNIESLGLVVDSTEIDYIPTTCILLEGESRNQVTSLVDNLEEMDDVQKVYTNLE